ncbi:hypothetical protein OUZ56_029394 [Daphnia magna]|uniref:Uncharacterized protein n=1 Tax=Daphnia magna TaxID=35525 RepID=A0ABR0B6P7_9CRUS|nr:hypothetical protein OUZ56_029394 [Daphnia magna]
MHIYGHRVRRYQSAVYPVRSALSIAPCTKRWARIKCGRGPRTADRINCGLSPAHWPKIFDSSPQFLHRVAVRSPRIIRAYGDTASTCLCVEFELDHRSALKSSFRRRQCGTKLCKEWYHKKCLPKEQHYAFQEFLKTPWIPQILLSLLHIWAWSPQIPVRSLSCPVRTFNRSMYETVRILSLSPRKICQKILGQSAGESPQFLLSASAFYPGPETVCILSLSPRKI